MEAKFHVADYVIFSMSLLASILIGLYYRFTGGRQRTKEEYLLADRQMNFLPVAFSLMASFMSAITILGVSSENYFYGMQFVIINISYGIATPAAAYVFLPVFYRLKTASVYEYLEQRFNVVVRLSAAFLFSIQMILYMGIVLYAPALALASVSGLSLNISIVVVGVACTIYSTIGGLKAVLVTDVLQSALMITAVLSVLIVGTIQFGDFQTIWDIAKDGGRLELFKFDLDPTVRHTFWNLAFGGIFLYLSLYAVNQAQVQRLMAVKNLRSAQAALWVQWPILTLLSISTCLSGIVTYAYYSECDPYSTGKITQKDQVLILFVVDTMRKYPGLSGLFISGLFSGSLSSISSSINSLVAVFMEDLIEPYLLKGRNMEKYKIMLMKAFAFGFGIICILIAFLAQKFGGILQASLTIFSVIGGPILGLFTMGILFPFVNSIGAEVGLLFSTAISLWIGFGGPKPSTATLPLSTDGCTNLTALAFDAGLTNVTIEALKSTEPSAYFYLYQLSYMWYSAIGFFAAICMGVVVSVCSGGNKNVDYNLMTSLVYSQEQTWSASSNLNKLVENNSFDAGTGQAFCFEGPEHEEDSSCVVRGRETSRF